VTTLSAEISMGNTASGYLKNLSIVTFNSTCNRCFSSVILQCLHVYARINPVEYLFILELTYCDDISSYSFDILSRLCAILKIFFVTFLTHKAIYILLFFTMSLYRYLSKVFKSSF
jgi:hypothetical protein